MTHTVRVSVNEKIILLLQLHFSFQVEYINITLSGLHDSDFSHLSVIVADLNKRLQWVIQQVH